MFAKHYADYPLSVTEISGENLVSLIEKGIDETAIQQVLQTIVSAFPEDIDGLILGCTHYPFIAEQLKQYIPSGCTIINPWYEAAHKLVDYCRRHTAIDAQLTAQKNTTPTRVVTTGSCAVLRKIVQQYVPHQTDQRDCLELPG